MELSIYSFKDAVDYLNWVYDKRRAERASFSLRSWARQMRLPHAATLSSVLRRKQRLPSDLAERLVRNLQLSKPEAEHFQLLALYSGESREEARTWLARRILEQTKDSAWPSLSLDTLRLIADWKKFLVLEALSCKQFNPKRDVLRTRFGDLIGRREIEDCIELFIRLGLVERTAEGSLQKPVRRFSTPHDVPDAELRQLQKSFLELSIAALENCPVDEREFSAALFVTSRKKIQGAKSRIRKFRQELAESLRDDDGDTVFAMNLSLFEILEEKPCAH